MLKLMVVLTRQQGMSASAFREYFKRVHEPMAVRIPGLRRYVQNFAMDDPKRKRPQWDAVIELYFDDWAGMEAAWATEQGQAATADLEAMADLNQSSWSVVEELVIRQ